jgi:outer membrane protein insertion porin family
LTKGLKEGEYLVYNVDVKGVKQSDKSAISDLVQQTPNTRIPLLNTSVGISIYRFGEWIYDSTRHINKNWKSFLQKETHYGNTVTKMS